MASRSDWADLRDSASEEDDEDFDDDDAFDEAIDGLDRGHEYSRYYEAQVRARELYDEYSDDEPDADDLDALHAHADLEERARSAACEDILGHGRWDDQDHDGHEHQADGWANRATNIWQARGLRTLEDEHDRIDRQHASGPGMLEGYEFDDQENSESERDDDDSASDEEYLRNMYEYDD